MTAITAITAQNTVGVSAIYPLPPEAILSQVQAVVEDIGVDAVKIGMLGNLATIEAVERALDLIGDAPVVVDPVMVAESGAILLEREAREALASRIVPRATVVTPNLPEARVLAGARGNKGAPADDAPPATEAPAADELDGEPLARAVHALGPRAVVITGGHRDEGADLFFDGHTFRAIPGERHPDGAAHGSGCTHSSALATYLGMGMDPAEAAERARAIAAEAVRHGLRGLGAGAGPVDVFHLDG